MPADTSEDRESSPCGFSGCSRISSLRKRSRACYPGPKEKKISEQDNRKKKSVRREGADDGDGKKRASNLKSGQFISEEGHNGELVKLTHLIAGNPLPYFYPRTGREIYCE